MKESDIDVDKTLAKLAKETRNYLKQRHRDDVALIGIRTGGVWIAQYLARELKLDNELGELNIAFYRDDFSRIGMHPTVEPSILAFDVTDKHLLLVDDILYTGRTVRAAMNEIFDYGRPASISLAVLIDRGGRELPVQADVIGASLSLAKDEHVKLTGPDPLRLEIGNANARQDS